MHIKIKQSSPITGLDRPGGFQADKVPRFRDNGTGDGGRLSALRTGRLYPPPPGNTPGTHFQCDRKEFMSMKSPLTPAGIKPANFRFVAQHPNHCATAVPKHYAYSLHF